MERKPRWTITGGGELVKLNLQQCPGCAAVYMSEHQASKMPVVGFGWYPDLQTMRARVESVSGVDPVIRISIGRRGKKICPTCSA